MNLSFTPSKRLGQNFLTDGAVLSKVIKAADLKSDDIVLEIGPGLGILTKELAKCAKKVIAVEKDKRLVEILKDKLRGFENVEIVHGDILKIEIWKLIENCLPASQAGKLEIGNYKIVANLPYYITSPVIRKFLESTETRSPCLMVVMVQKEVAQRICAKPPRMSLLAVSVQFYAKPEIISYVSKSSFWPKPKVDSAILRIMPINRDIHIDIPKFFKLVKAGFAHPRKQLVNNLSTGLKLNRVKVEKWLLDNGIQPKQRAETLSVENWQNLFAGQDF